VTLLGVVLLLALAASRGWFTPPARVAFGAVLGAGLVGLGVWLHRRESARAGALALVATGFATLYLVDAAATAVFGYLPAFPALLLALGIAGAGLGLADRWRTQLLAGGSWSGPPCSLRRSPTVGSSLRWSSCSRSPPCWSCCGGGGWC
jgi:uncharacterized membrane protein